MECARKMLKDQLSKYTKENVYKDNEKPFRVSLTCWHFTDFKSQNAEGIKCPRVTLKVYSNFNSFDAKKQRRLCH